MNDEDKAYLAHRDDVPMKIVEKIEKMFAETHPGMKVVFAGDHEHKLDPEVRKRIDALAKRAFESRQNGTCFGCGKTWNGYDAWLDNQDGPHPGWNLCWDMQGKPSHLMCDACDQRLNESRGQGIGMISLESLEGFINEDDE